MKKRVSMLLVFIIGLTLFATSVLASTTSKSGYEILRDSIENTFFSSHKFGSLTANTRIKLRYDNTEVYTQTITSRNDYKNSKKSSETITKSLNYNNYSYSYDDKEKYIYTYNGDEYTWNDKSGDIYYSEYTSYAINSYSILRKIADAAVSTFNLQNMITTARDGRKGYILNFSCDEGQIPAVINAIISVIYTDSFRDNFEEYSSTHPDIKALEDLYIKNVTVEAHVNGDNILDRIYTRLVFAGLDNERTEHEIIAESLYELSDIDSTVVTEPNLDGKKVYKNSITGKEPIDHKEPQNGDYDKLKPLLGKYVSNEIEVRDDQMIKNGEYVLELNEFVDEESGKVKAVKYRLVDGEKFDIEDIVLELSNQDDGLPLYFKYKNIILMKDSDGYSYRFFPDDGVVLISDNINMSLYSKVFE